MTEVGIENINFEQPENSKYIDHIGTQKKYQKVFINSQFSYEIHSRTRDRGTRTAVLERRRTKDFLRVRRPLPL